MIRRSNRASLRSPDAARAKEAEENLAWAEHSLVRQMYDEAEQYAVVARELYEAGGDQWAAANAVAFLGDIEASRGPEGVDRALEVYLEAGQRLRDIHDDQALCRVLTARGRLLFDQDRLEEATAELNEAVALDPTNREAAQALADALWYSGAYEQALEAFSRCLRIDPLSSGALNGRGQLLADLGHSHEALTDLDLLLTLGPDMFTEAYARSARALALEGLGRSLDADRDLKFALDSTPENAWAHLRRAKILEHRGKTSDARRALKQALASREPALTDAQRVEAQAMLGREWYVARARRRIAPDGDMRVLVTGFGPFLDVQRNPSGDVLPLLAPGVSTMLLPVEYERATRLLLERLEAEKPHATVLLGLAEGEHVMRLETVATNRDEAAVPDNAGQVRNGIPVVSGAVPTYRSTLPTSRLEAALGRAGFAATRSTDAGGYVCNHVYFQARHFIEGRGLGIGCGLIHVPVLDDGAG